MSTFTFRNGWRPFPLANTKKLGCHPNQLWRANDRKAGALVVMKGRNYEEYALSRVGLDYLNAALQGKRIEQAVVVMADWRDHLLTVISEKTVSEVVASLAHQTPREGPFGPYHWMNADLSPYAPDLDEDDLY